MKPIRLLAFLCLAAVPAIAAAPKLLVKNGLFLTMAEKTKDPFTGYMTVGSDGKILAVEAGDPPASLKAEATYDAGGKFISPGFVSSHSHIWQSCFRGVGADGTLFDWIASFSTLSTRGSDEDFYNWTLHGCLDFIKYGVTTAYNFTNAGNQWTGYNTKPQPYRPGHFEEKEFQAEIESGLRFTHSFSVSLAYTDAERRARIQGLIDYAKPYAKDPHFLKFAISGGSAFATDKEQAYMEARLM
jgi:cytosine/adenosine deaminase-related metal-dependent hydrolase